MYCGTDIIEVDRIKDAIQNTSKFKENVFTKVEIEDIEKCAEKVKYQRYAGRFAAKEAVYKAISKILVENGMDIGFLKIEIINLEDMKRRPIVRILDDDINKILSSYDIDISISHVAEYANSMCVVSKKIT